jgi:hypothetical protein
MDIPPVVNNSPNSILHFLDSLLFSLIFPLERKSEFFFLLDYSATTASAANAFRAFTNVFVCLFYAPHPSAFNGKTPKFSSFCCEKSLT